MQSASIWNTLKLLQNFKKITADVIIINRMEAFSWRKFNMLDNKISRPKNAKLVHFLAMEF